MRLARAAASTESRRRARATAGAAQIQQGGRRHPVAGPPKDADDDREPEELPYWKLCRCRRIDDYYEAE